MLGLGLGLVQCATRPPAWVVPGAVLDLHLAGRRYWMGDRELAFPATTSRASTAQALDATGMLQEFAANQPRILPGMGLLVEESRANLIKRSNDFSDSSWTKTAATITGSYANSPLGTNTASRCQFTSATYSQLQVYLSGLSTDKTFSVWLKTNTGQADATVTIFLAGVTTNVTVTSAWERFDYSVSNAATTEGARIAKRDIWNSAGTADLLIAGAQLETGTFPTSYIKTQGAAATRAADAVNLADVTWLADDMTWVAQWDGIAASGTDRTFWAADDATLNNEIITQISAAGLTGTASTTGGTAGGSWQTPTNAGDDGASHKLAVSYDQSAGTYRWSLDGAVAVDDTGNTILAASAVSRLAIGHRKIAALANGQLIRLIAIPGFKSATDVQALST